SPREPASLSAPGRSPGGAHRRRHGSPRRRPRCPPPERGRQLPGPAFLWHAICASSYPSNTSIRIFTSCRFTMDFERVAPSKRAGSPSVTFRAFSASATLGFTMKDRVELYDTTLRDGTQMEGISLSVDDKIKIARRMDELGVHYIEGGYPGSNPKDIEFFGRASELNLKTARLAAFGTTRKAGGRADTDPNFKALIAANTPVVTIVAKAHDRHVTHVLETTLEENLSMIGDSVRHLKEAGRTVFLDAEHFFDGLKANRDYAVQCLKTAATAGADCAVLCDTNGGTI